MKSKILFYISGIIAILFIATLIFLNVAEVINFGSMIAFVVVIMILVVGVNVVMWYIRTRKQNDEEPDKSIGLEEARRLALNEIREQYSEKEREKKHDGVWNMGLSKTPIYTRLLVGDFDGKYISILINMNNPDRKDSKTYPLTDLQQKIEEDVLKRANSLADVPKPEDKYRTIESIDSSTGRIVAETTPITPPDKQEEQGGLK